MKKGLIFVFTVMMLIGCASFNESVIGIYQPSQGNNVISVPDNMVFIESGIFSMKTGNGDTEFQATISNFYISKYEVTVGEFRRFINATGYITTGTIYGNDVWIQSTPGKKHPNAKNPSWDNTYMEQDENHPVVLVSWIDALEYCNWLSLQEGLRPAYIITNDKKKYDVIWDRTSNGYRLPTAPEWEYACRAGTTTPYYYGDTADMNTGWYFENSNITTHPVGTMPANPWGLYDMLGNASEWTWSFAVNPYSSSPQTDPIGPAKHSNKNAKGYSFLFPFDRTGRSGYGWIYSRGSNDLGFRVAKSNIK